MSSLSLLAPFIPGILAAAEQAALACHSHIGRGNEHEADQAAVSAMRQALNAIAFQGTVVIGEGERDEAPMLYIGEKVGMGTGTDLKVDIALDPLEGTTLCATNAPGSITVLAVATEGGFLHAPDVYMDKIAVGGAMPEGTIDLDDTPAINLKRIAKAKQCDVSDLMVTILKRTRHEELIARVRETGAKVQLIQDGDVMAVVGVIQSIKGGSDVYMGTGGAPEGVLAAAVISILGGQMRGRLLFENAAQIERAATMGVTDPHHQYSAHEMAKGEIVFVASGVTTGDLLQGVCPKSVHSVIYHSAQPKSRMVSSTF
jgi:fructose-1,6-bisphosphatase II / sedoheptulose-1,7-bisphosphatase